MMGGWLRVVGDLAHLLSLMLLLRKMWSSASCTGVSLKTQELYLLVFVARYWDLFSNFYSVYNTIMKVLFIAATLAIVYLMRVRYAKSLSECSAQDSLPRVYLIVPALLLALVFNEEPDGFLSDPFEISWAFSIFLEAVAILPQCVLNRARNGLVDILTADYVFCLGAYRLLYLLSWILRWAFDETYIHSWVAFLGGIVQTIFYCDFFYYYLLGKRNQALQLPV